MRILTVGPVFIANYQAGKKEFEKLSDTEKTIKVGFEIFRQNYNSTHSNKLTQLKGDLAAFIKRKVSFKIAFDRAIKKLLEKSPF